MPHPDTTTVIRQLLDGCSAEAVRAREQAEAAIHRAFIDTAFNLADQYVISDIEVNAIEQHDADGIAWWDVAAMVNPHEHAPESIDMASQALAFALARRLFEPHAQFPNLWRKVSRT